MKIKKIAHCCLLVEIGGKKILTDPGNYSTDQNSFTGIDAIVITHEHGDHYHAESVQAIVKNNPNAAVIANAAVGKLLDELGVKHVVMDGRDKGTINTIGAGMNEQAGLAIEAFDCRHEEIFEEIGQVQNTGYLIGDADGENDSFFIPGDAYCDPGTYDLAKAGMVKVLALPFAGPWLKLSDTIRYAIRMKPKMAFPVHDGIMKPTPGGGFGGKIAQGVLKERAGIEFVIMQDGDEKEF